MLNIQKINHSIPKGMWITSLYFIEGLPFSLVNTVSVALFKTLQISNSQIGLFTSLFYIPWAIKFFWAPLVDYISNKRRWIISMQAILAILTALLSLCIYGCQTFTILCIVFAFIAFASATYDIACDGYYLDSLSMPDQSLYIGWRNTAYKLAWLFASGFLVYIAGLLASNSINKTNYAWSVAFLLAALIMAAASIFHNFALPKMSIKSTNSFNSQNLSLVTTFKKAFISFFQQDKIILILCWIILFRAGDAMLLKMAQPFLLDMGSKGGLGLALQEVGLVYGSIGMVFLLLGGITGGWLVFKYELKKCLMPTAVLQSVTLLLYWFLAITKPGLLYVIIANSCEQFIYGLATAAYTSYLFTIVKENFLASHYAIATGFMAIGMIIPGALSGYLVDNLGYRHFFLISFFASIPGIICTLSLPFHKMEQNNVP